jgi:C1A family cysteine protease
MVNKKFATSIVLFAFLLLLLVFTHKPTGNFMQILDKAEFDEYISNSGKVYSSEEYEKRQLIFKDNLEYIKRFNQQGESWYLGVNEFTDMTKEEFKEKYLSSVGQLSENFEKTLETQVGQTRFKYPASVDWRSAGAVTPVSSQGGCKCSWAFSATGAVESARKIGGGQLVELSKQQLVDCSSRYGNNGCTSGTIDYAFDYIRDNGIASEASYPFFAKAGTCKSGINPVASLSYYIDLQPNNPSALYEAIAQQPVAVAVYADPTIWQNYKGGVISKNCPADELDFAVLIIGYNSVSNPPYWIAKASYGQNWGESGYIRLAIVDGSGICGVQSQASYPIVN